jgi:hypothetical protein
MAGILSHVVSGTLPRREGGLDIEFKHVVDDSTTSTCVVKPQYNI